MSEGRAARLIALLGHIPRDTPTRIDDLARCVGTTEAELADDLLSLATCGVAPYGPESLVPLIIEDGLVTLWGEIPALSGPVRLSRAEARALAMALQSAGFHAHDSLTARLLEAAGSRELDATELEHTIRIASAPLSDEVYETLACAQERHEVARLDYVRAGSDEVAVRDIEPVGLFLERSVWYTTGWCRRAGGWRTFRLDRIRRATLTGERFDLDARPTVPLQGARPYEGMTASATLRFAPEEAFSERDWPGGRVLDADDNGSLVVTVPFGGTEWIARRIAARGGRVEALEPPQIREAVASLARRELEDA